jgi:phosphoglycerol transferase MdoB-like AlkP superfamily enzyme
MKKQVIRQFPIFFIVNFTMALFFLFIYKMFRYDFKIDVFFLWLHDYTKIFAIYLSILFLAFISLIKVQITIFSVLKKRYSWAILLLKYLLIFLILMGASILTNYYLQYFQSLKDPILTVQWIGDKPNAFFAGVLYLLFIFFLIYALLGNVFISSFLTSVVLYIIGFTHYNKLKLRGEPLYPMDYKQFSQLKDVIPMIKEYLSINQLLLAVLFMLFVGILLFLLPKLNISFWTRGFIILVTLPMIYSFTFFPNTFMKSYLENSGVKVDKWNQPFNYQSNGFLFGFVSNIYNGGFEEPEGYSKQRVLKIAEKYVKKANKPTSEKTPNVVFLMSESFWDPTKLKIGFSDDPMKNIRTMMTQYPSGQILSPAFGGGTANVEFEALTGFTTSFLSEGILPYQDLVPNKTFIPTIVSDLENKGYRSLAIHPYNKIFYKRNLAYKTFGFDQFLDEETMNHTNRTRGGLITDESLTLEILDNITKQEKPLFVHAVSMQNHMPYAGNNYEGFSIGISGLRQESIWTIESYTEGIKRTDEAFKLLVEQLEKIDEPTIVVFWGDHLPILGENFSIYKESGYYEDIQGMDIKFFQTPLLIYTNFETAQKDLELISPFYLAPIVYEISDLEKPGYYNLLDQLYSEIPAMKGPTKIGADQKSLIKLTKKQKQLLEDYKMLEYDLLIGKQYSKDLLYPQN